MAGSHLVASTLPAINDFKRESLIWGCSLLLFTVREENEKQKSESSPPANRRGKIHGIMREEIFIQSHLSQLFYLDLTFLPPINYMLN